LLRRQLLGTALDPGADERDRLNCVCRARGATLPLGIHRLRQFSGDPLALTKDGLASLHGRAARCFDKVPDGMLLKILLARLRFLFSNAERVAQGFPEPACRRSRYRLRRQASGNASNLGLRALNRLGGNAVRHSLYRRFFYGRGHLLRSCRNILSIHGVTDHST
jgi:hypothetical protein